ncbi:hypothetical protein [Vibrio sp. Isolate30]|uniref:hypothetical protein n=1 Tax=Vibrio sp. Isolate30 TaxID=2908536 RepID=UPI001EFC7D9C|nr:hypothetical protein [Vibrio sp. Isolate30]MCG9632403.1 hypothetical protein [Vibrio sp. Isolate30]
MRKLIPTILTTAVALTLHGCGGGGGGGGSTSAPAPTQSFSDISVPSSFEWSGSTTRDLTINVVSEVSQRDGQAAAIRGSHIVKLYSMSSDGTDSQPFFTGMTNSDGQLTNSLSLLDTWQGIKLVALVRGDECVSQVESADIMKDLYVSCDIVLDAD